MRYCFTSQVRADRTVEYTERHRAVWPDTLAALKASRWHNDSLFLRDDNTVIGRPPDHGLQLIPEIFHLEDQPANEPAQPRSEEK